MLGTWGETSISGAERGQRWEGDRLALGGRAAAASERESEAQPWALSSRLGAQRPPVCPEALKGLCQVCGGGAQVVVLGESLWLVAVEEGPCETASGESFRL